MGWARLAAKIWLGRMDESTVLSSITSKQQLAWSFQKVRLKASFTFSAVAFSSSARAEFPKRSDISATIRRALYQRALISTALPERGVMTQSPTRASIQVTGML